MSFATAMMVRQCVVFYGQLMEEHVIVACPILQMVRINAPRPVQQQKLPHIKAVNASKRLMLKQSPKKGACAQIFNLLKRLRDPVIVDN